MQSRRRASFSSCHKLGFHRANSVSNRANLIDFSWYIYQHVWFLMVYLQTRIPVLLSDSWTLFIGVQMQAEPKRSGPSTSINSSRKTATPWFCPWCQRILIWSKKQEGAHLISEATSPFPVLWPCRGRWLEPEHGRWDFLAVSMMTILWKRMLWCQILLIIGS